MKSNKTVGCVTNSGEEKIMEAEKQTIAVFTNIFGEVNKGVVLAVDPGGLVKIRWERFDQMIERLLKQRASSRDMLESSLGERIGWPRPSVNRENGSRLVLVNTNERNTNYFYA